MVYTFTRRDNPLWTGEMGCESVSLQAVDRLYRWFISSEEIRNGFDGQEQ